jgi:hypothetical protein
MNRFAKLTTILALAVFMTGCSGKDKTAEPAGDSGDKEKYLLTEEPAGAKGVIEARKKTTKDGEEVVVVGRIGGNVKPWVEGRAAFWIVDGVFKPCNEKDDDKCPTPWDYCCDAPEDLRKGMATIKIVDDKGQTVAVDARKLLGVKELDTVVVKGKAKRDEEGNLTVLASGLFVRPGRK